MSQSQALGNEDVHDSYLVAVVILTVVATITAWLRVYVRVFIIKNPGWDDWIMFLASLLSLLTNAFLIQTYSSGLGKHVTALAPEAIPAIFEFLWLVQATNMFALYFIRLSISLTFLRIIPKTRTHLRAFVWCLIALLTASTIHITVIYMVECIPIQKVWRPETPGWCISDAAYESGPWIYQGLSILTDTIIVAIAISLFSRLQTAVRTKLAITLLCSMGIFTCVCAIIKTAFLPDIFDTNPDKTWTLAKLGLFAALEICVGIVCGCLPCLRPLFEVVSERISSTQKRLTWSYGSDGFFTKSRAMRLRSNSSSTQHPAPSIREIHKTTEIEVSSVPRLYLEKEEDRESRQEEMELPIHPNAGV